MANFLSNLFQPIAPGLSGAINPLAFIGAGMASGDMGSALSNMAQIQQNAARIAAEQQYRQQMLGQQQTEASAMEQYRRQQMMMDAIKQRALQEHRAAQLARGTGLQQNLIAAGLQPGTPEFQDAMLQAVTKPQVAITGETGPQLPAPPSGMYRPTPGQPGLEMEPGFETTQQRQLAAQEQKAQKARNEVQTALANYRDLVQEHGIEIMPGETKGRLKAAHTAATMKLKEAYNLGALSGADLELMLGTLPDVTTFGAATTYGGAGGALSAIEETIRGFGGQAATAAGAPGQPITLSGTEEEMNTAYENMPSGTEFIGPDGVTRRKP